MNSTTSLEVTDNGCGFDKALPTDRYGIAGMRERALLVGGELTVVSEPNVGTTVKLEVK
jgi:signal transduction histidine kinase